MSRKSQATRLIIMLYARIRYLIPTTSAALIAFAVTAVFFGPMIVRRSANAGLLYTGDVLGCYWPAMLKTHSLLSQGNYAALDFSSYNGSSDYFLAPNYFMMHPLILASSAVSLRPHPLDTLGQWLVIVMALHAVAACFFTQRLLEKWFSFRHGPAIIAATTFAFNLNVVHSIGEPMFLFCTAAAPTIAYAALWFTERPTISRALLAAAPVIVGFMAGYVPLAVTSICVSVVLIILSILHDTATHSHQGCRASALHVTRRIFLAMIPLGLATVVVFPYYIAVYNNTKATISADVPSLFFSAHQLSQDPVSVLNHLTLAIQPTKYHEFRFVAGFIVITILFLFLGSQQCRDSLLKSDWFLIQTCSVIYFSIALATFGNYSPLSDLIYYAVPQIGGMHIYQRFLLFAQFFQAIATAIMLRAVVEVRPARLIGLGFLFSSVLVLVTAHLISRYPAMMAEQGINSYVLYELILCALFVLSLYVPSRAFVYAVTTSLMLLPSLDLIYDYASGRNTRVEQRVMQPMALDGDQQDRFLAWVNALPHAPNKEIIKYVDLTKLWANNGRETFPKSFPWLVLNKVRLSSYHGFEFRMGATAQYLESMPMAVREETWVLNPNWDTVLAANADFVIAYESDIESGLLSPVLGEQDRSRFYRLPGGLLAAPLPQWQGGLPPENTAFDNGLFQITARVPNSCSDLTNVARGRSAVLSSIFSGRSGSAAVDGDTDGSLDRNSIAHSDKDSHAWLDIDLEQARDIYEIRLWNVEKYEFRLADYWVFISDQPFPADATATDLSQRSGTWACHRLSAQKMAMIDVNGARGRYVRIQLGGNARPDAAYLHLAEVEVLACSNEASGIDNAPVHHHPVRVSAFDSNFANRSTIEWESEAPTRLRYLFAANPRLTYLLDGNVVQPTASNGLLAFDVGPGRHRVDIQYRHTLLTVFWIGFVAYLVLLCVICLGVLLSFLSTLRRLGSC
jgi:hypothetical protein